MSLIIRHLGVVDYVDSWQQMREFTDLRTHDTADEIWLLQHHPVYTLGKNGKPEHVLDPAAIPVIDADRGGQVTYHGPGQLVAYTLLDLNRLGIGVRQLVTQLENCVIDLLAAYGVDSSARQDAPGVYVKNAKIAALGLRVRKGCCFHGLALNVDMDLEPFTRINPCGYAGMQVTQLSDLVAGVRFHDVVDAMQQRLQEQFSR